MTTTEKGSERALSQVQFSVGLASAEHLLPRVQRDGRRPISPPRQESRTGLAKQTTVKAAIAGNENRLPPEPGARGDELTTNGYTHTGIRGKSLDTTRRTPTTESLRSLCGARMN
jgi:hypothetical protein